MGYGLNLQHLRYRKSQLALMALMALVVLMVPVMSFAGTTGVEFKEFYDFVYGASTGYLGRGIAITGGLIMLGTAAATGKAVIAIMGIVLAIFGAIGPIIIDAIFKSAII